ncbi:MAG: tRNA pseudouridine(38-40) synthase TruA [Bacteroidota bacterium]
MPFRYFIRLAFDGTQYHGWQLQDNANTVQEEITKALSVILKNRTELLGCGRTDTGVHASEFFAHFDCETDLGNTEKLTYQLNSLLPDDIFVFFIKKVKEDLHARFTATRRTYKYFINRHNNPFNKSFEHVIHRDFDLEAMNTACKVLMKYTDFSCFSKSHTQVNNNNCKIYEAYWVQAGSQIIFTITANRFLRNMVRAIVGTLLEIGSEKIGLTEFRKIIEKGNRSDAGVSVPAKGLFLHKVTYPDGSF